MKNPGYFPGLRRGGDKFRGMHAQADGERQLEYAEKTGMGTRNYNLINL
jgi:uncharacterized Fe-S center protein